jgi:hypothetical protein
VKSQKYGLLSIAQFACLIFLLARLAFAEGSVVTGTVFDADSREPVPYATVRLLSTGRSMSANEAGVYRIRLARGSHQLKFSHLSHYSEQFELVVGDSTIERDVYLKSSRIEVPGIVVSARNLSAGQRIIYEAIERKAEILGKLQSYSALAYTKTTVRDESKPDSTSISYLIETQLESFWEALDNYKEIVTARRVSVNLVETDAVVTVGEILNFNENRLDIAGDRPVVSPTADDALKFYNYYLLDTIEVDGRDVFRLEMEPRNDIDPLLAGEILIVDSTYDVVGVDATLGKGIETMYVDDVRLVQTYSLFENEIWMPVEIRLEFAITLPIPGIPPYFINYLGVLHDYKLNISHPESTFDDYLLEIAETVDDVDSTTWESNQMVPLTVEEVNAYARIDSVENEPRPVQKRLLNASLRALFLTVVPNDFFHFNRVEGAYLGAGVTIKPRSWNTSFKLKSGYAFAGEYWQHQYAATFTFDRKRRLKFSLGYHDLILPRPTIVSDRSSNPAFMSAMFKYDPFDYYLERGFDLLLSTKVVQHVDLSLGYHDQNHYSVEKSTEFSVLDTDRKHRINPAIDDGKLRAFSAMVRYDSRRRLLIKGEDQFEFTGDFTTAEFGVEASDPDFLQSDFHYQRFHVRVFRQQPMLGLGVSKFNLYLGTSERLLPPQRTFTVDYGSGVLVDDLYFKTLGDTNFVGFRAAAVYYAHDFGRYLFVKSGIPLIRDIPLSIGFFGGMFWSEMRRVIPVDQGGNYAQAIKPYSEIGFQIGRITPLNLKFDFSWQLSHYDTHKFSFGFAGFLFD